MEYLKNKINKSKVQEHYKRTLFILVVKKKKQDL